MDGSRFLLRSASGGDAGGTSRLQNPPSQPYLDRISVIPHRPDASSGSGWRKLLIQPVSIPSLDHTGIRTAFDPPQAKLIRPDGKVHRNLKVLIQDSLRCVCFAGWYVWVWVWVWVWVGGCWCLGSVLVAAGWEGRVRVYTTHTRAAHGSDQPCAELQFYLLPPPSPLGALHASSHHTYHSRAPFTPEPPSTSYTCTILTFLSPVARPHTCIVPPHITL